MGEQTFEKSEFCNIRTYSVLYFTICIFISIIIYNMNSNRYGILVNTNNNVNVILNNM